MSQIHFPSPKAIFRGEITIWMVYFLLATISLIEVFSAASSLTFKGASYWFPLLKHGGFLLGGAAMAILFLNVPIRVWKPLSPALYLLGVFLVFITLFLGHEVNGAARWIRIFGISIQGSEFAKVGIIAMVSLVLSRSQGEKGPNKRALWWIVGLVSIPVVLILFENLSTAAIICVVVFMLCIIGRIPFRQWIKWVGIGAFLLALFSSCIYFYEKSHPGELEKTPLHRASTWILRLTTHQEGRPSDPKLFNTYKDSQIAHANIAIASSGFIGKGPGNSVERDFLNLAYSDFIFAIVIEELGLLGAIAVIFLYVVLLYRTRRIAMQCDRYYPAFFSMGLALMLTTQAFLNMLVAVDIFPVTGQPLPLISHGGTSILVTGFYFGVILSISRYARRDTNVNNLPTPSSEAALQPNEAEFQNNKGLS